MATAGQLLPSEPTSSEGEPRDDLTDARRIERRRRVDGSEAGNSLQAWLVTGSVRSVWQHADRRGLRTDARPAERRVVQIGAVENVDELHAKVHGDSFLDPEHSAQTHVLHRASLSGEIGRVGR